MNFLKQKKGQSIIEFAVVLPLLLFLFLAIIYVGMLLADYVSLENLARQTARLGAMGKTQAAVIEMYEADETQTTLPEFLYTWNPGDDSALIIKPDTDTMGRRAKVTIQATRREGVTTLNIMGHTIGLPEKLRIQYSMHYEVPWDE